MSFAEDNCYDSYDGYVDDDCECEELASVKKQRDDLLEACKFFMAKTSRACWDDCTNYLRGLRNCGGCSAYKDYQDCKKRVKAIIEAQND